MCLTNNPKEVESLLKKNVKTFVGYKIVRVGWCGNTSIMSLIYSKVWRAGTNYSTSRRKRACVKNESIFCGIHMYRSKKDAIRLLSNGKATMRVTFQKIDLLGANFNEMVAKKVDVSRQEILRVKSRLGMN